MVNPSFRFSFQPAPDASNDTIPEDDDGQKSKQVLCNLSPVGDVPEGFSDRHFLSPFDAALTLFDLLCQNWNQIKNIFNDTIVCGIEDGGCRVCVNGDNRVAASNSFRVFRGSTDS